MKTNRNRMPFRALLPAILAIVIFLAGGCNKSDKNKGTDPNAVFIGTYYGTITTGLFSNADTIVIAAGSNSSAIIMNSRTGAGSVYSVSGTVSGTSITMASQQVYVPSFSESFTVTGTGSLSGTALQLSMTFVSPSSVSSILNVAATKQ